MLNRLRCLHSLGFIDFESISFKVNRGRYKERKECLSLFNQKSFVTFNSLMMEQLRPKTMILQGDKLLLS